MARMQEQIEKTAREYAEREGTSFEFAIRDVLTDVMHLCDKHGIDFDLRLAGASDVYEEEKELES